jgi:hypothetical protein
MSWNHPTKVAEALPSRSNQLGRTIPISVACLTWSPEAGYHVGRYLYEKHRWGDTRALALPAEPTHWWALPPEPERDLD